MNENKNVSMTSFDFDEYNFKTISDFKWCMKQGGEVEFEWNREYSITHTEGMINICEYSTEENEKNYRSIGEYFSHIANRNAHSFCFAYG